MGSVIGIDLSAVVSVSDALGYDTAAVIDLIECCNAGMMDALEEQRAARGE